MPLTILPLTPKSREEPDFFLHHPEHIHLPRHFPRARVPGFVPNPLEATTMIATAMQGDPYYRLAGDDQPKMRAYLNLVFDTIYWAPQLTSLVSEYLQIIVTNFMAISLEKLFRPEMKDSDLDDEEVDWGLDGEEEKGGAYVTGILPSDSLGRPCEDLAMWKGARSPVLAKL